MTLSEELCAIFNELGIEYTTYDTIADEAVIWTGSVCKWIALPSEYGLAVAVYKDYLTPEQAIAATVGAGTCHMRLLENTHGGACRDVYECDRCGGQVLRDTCMGKSEPPKFCPECGKKVIEIEVDDERPNL